VLVFACRHCGAADLRGEAVPVLEMPCVAMLPPAFIDFALSRKLADGVLLAGCAAGDCHYRLGDEWLRQRLTGERDPYLRSRVDRSRLQVVNTHAGSRRARRRALEALRARLAAATDSDTGGGSGDAA